MDWKCKAIKDLIGEHVLSGVFFGSLENCLLNEGIKILNSVGTTDCANGGVINPEDTIDGTEILLCG